MLRVHVHATRERSLKMTCSEWLKNELDSSSDPVLCDKIRAKAKELGYSKRELKEARVKLGVKTFHLINEDSETNWFWYLPEEGNNA